MADGDRSAQLLVRLAVPGERLGWIFTDRRLYRRRFPEPEPERGEVPERLRRRYEAQRGSVFRRIFYSVRAGAIVIALVGLFAVLASEAQVTDYLALALGLLLFWTVLVVAVLGLRLLLAWLALAAARTWVGRRHRRAVAGWEQRRQRHDEDQIAAVADLLDWSGAAPTPDTGRLDVVGGTASGWAALLTVFGGSLLATRGPMTLVDFTGGAASGELIRLARATDRTVATLRLPGELDRFDPVGALGPADLVTCLVEAMHGDVPEASRADRAQDTLLLTEICQVLEPRPTMARLLAALRVLLDRPAQAALTAEEIDRLLDLHPDESRRQLHAQLRRFEAFVHPLETMGSGPAARDADLFCVLIDDHGRSARRESLKEIVVQWLARRARTPGPGRAGHGSLVLVGADDVHHRALEQLGTLCERGGVRLVVLFAHLRDESVPAIGGGEVAFMRLGNHWEAAQAADFIGKGHRFVLSQLTRTTGGNETRTTAQSLSESATESMTAGRTWARYGSAQQSETASFTRTLGETESLALGTNWTDAEARQRVYEYAVEPRVLQDLPDYALIMVQRQRDGSVVRVVEVNPEIATLPRMSMDPVELPPLPGQDEALHPFDEPARPGS